MEQVIQWGMLSETSIVTNVYEINPYKHLLLKLSLLLADCISIVIREDQGGFCIRKLAKRGHCTRAEQECCIMTD